MQNTALAGFYVTERDPTMQDGYPMIIRKPDPTKTEITMSVINPQ